MKKYFVEFIGAFFLVFTIGNVVVAPGVGLFAPAIYKLIHSDE